MQSSFLSTFFQRLNDKISKCAISNCSECWKHFVRLRTSEFNHKYPHVEGQFNKILWHFLFSLLLLLVFYFTTCLPMEEWERVRSICPFPHNLDLGWRTRIETRRPKASFAYGKYLPFGSSVTVKGGWFMGLGMVVDCLHWKSLLWPGKQMGAYGRGRDPSHLGGWHWAMGGTERRATGKMAVPHGVERLSAASRGPLPEKENSVLGKDLLCPPSVDKPVEPTVLYVLPSQSAMTMKTKAPKGPFT